MTIHESNETADTSQPSQSTVLLLALTAGAGLVLMMLALAIGVVQGEAADATTVGLTFAGGLALLVFGIAGWLATVQPFKHFDDINEPHYTGHHDHAAHEEHEETAIIPHEE